MRPDPQYKKIYAGLPEEFLPYEALAGTEPFPVLVALSGGADSRVLFELTAKMCEQNGQYFYACHVNHGIRGAEAIRDRNFCRALAEGCPYCREIFILDADVPTLCRESGRSVEFEARLLRYGFFEKVMKEHNLKVLATAHNASDNLETLIFNLTRGSGIKGMCGIPPVREFAGGLIVRPMLGMPKSEILGYCRENSLEYVTDSTNFEIDCSRNLIRAKVIPELEKINPAVTASAGRLSSGMRGVCEYLEGACDANLTDGGLSPDDVVGCPDALLPFVLSGAAEKAGYDVSFEAVHVREIRRICEGRSEGAKVSLPGGVCAVIGGGLLRFKEDVREKKPKAGGCCDFSLELRFGDNLLPDGSVLKLGRAPFSDEEYGKANIYKFATKACIKSATINEGFTLRYRKEGDRIFTSGMNKSVRKLMQEAKVPENRRDRFPIVCDGDVAVLIPGIAINDLYRGNEIFVLWSE